MTRLTFPMPLQLMHLRLNAIMCRTNPRPLQYAHVEKIFFVSKSTGALHVIPTALRGARNMPSLRQRAAVMKEPYPTKENLCKRILTPENGKRITDATVGEILARHGHLRTKGFRYLVAS
jgi:hypothetical protein